MDTASFSGLSTTEESILFRWGDKISMFMILRKLGHFRNHKKTIVMLASIIPNYICDKIIKKIIYHYSHFNENTYILIAIYKIYVNEIMI